MDYKIRGSNRAFFLSFMLFLILSPFTAQVSSAQVTDFNRMSTPGASITEHTYRRIEHFLSHVFPIRQMRRYAHVTLGAHPDRLRHVTYKVVAQEGINFVLAGYSVQGNSPINELAIYRIEPDGGPNQVWRSRPWEGASGDLHFQAVPIRDRNIVLFQEGGNEGEFGLASVFTFRNAPEGLFLRDLTPELPWLRARDHFPFRTLYGEQISMRLADGGSHSMKNPEKQEVVLSASDEEYNLGMARLIRPARSWKYNMLHNRFERMKATPSLSEPEATNSR